MSEQARKAPAAELTERKSDMVEAYRAVEATQDRLDALLKEHRAAVHRAEESYTKYQDALGAHYQEVGYFRASGNLRYIAEDSVIREIQKEGVLVRCLKVRFARFILGVVGADKLDAAAPIVFVKDPRGQKYWFKHDANLQLQAASEADFISAQKLADAREYGDEELINTTIALHLGQGQDVRARVLSRTDPEPVTKNVRPEGDKLWLQVTKVVRDTSDNLVVTGYALEGPDQYALSDEADVVEINLDQPGVVGFSEIDPLHHGLEPHEIAQLRP